MLSKAVAIAASLLTQILLPNRGINLALSMRTGKLNKFNAHFLITFVFYTRSM